MSCFQFEVFFSFLFFSWRLTTLQQFEVFNGLNICVLLIFLRASQVVLVVKHLPASVGQIRDVGWIPGSGRFPGEGHGTPVLLPGESLGQRGLEGYGP